LASVYRTDGVTALISTTFEIGCRERKRWPDSQPELIVSGASADEEILAEVSDLGQAVRCRGETTTLDERP
jgi:hypothetical protein